MFTTVVLLFALLGITFAKLDVESSSPSTFAKVTPMAGGVVVDGFSYANNLTMPCNNKFCEMLKYTATCKSLNLGMKKICAIHLLGYKYGCDAFPPASDVVKAPSICIPSALKILKPIQTNAAVALAAILTPYLDPKSFVADNCDRHCFQNFQYATHDFFSTCRPQITKKIPIVTLQSAFQEYRNQACARNPNGQNCYTSIMSLVPTTSTSTFSELFSIFQSGELTPEEEYMQAETLEQFKQLLEDKPLVEAGAIEASIPEGLESPFVGGSNVQLQDIIQEEQEVSVDATIAEPRRALQTGATNDIFNFQCNYTSGTTAFIPGTGTVPSNSYNNVFKNGICQKLSAMGCCAGTGLTMIQQNPVSSIPALASGGTPDPTIFPPCLYRYLNDACPTVNLQNYCTNGSIASNTVNRGTVKVPYLAPNNIPNMYVKLGALTIQAVIQYSLKDMGFGVWPYLFSNPLQIQIVDYAYGTGNGATIVTPTNGAMLVPYGSDYTAANTPGVGGFGLFTFQIVNQDLNATTSAILFQALTSTEFSQKVSFYLTNFQSGVAVQATATQAPVIYEAKPFVFDNAAGSVSAHKGAQWLVTLGLTLGASIWLMKSAAV